MYRYHTIGNVSILMSIKISTVKYQFLIKMTLLYKNVIDNFIICKALCKTRIAHFCDVNVYKATNNRVR